MIKEYLDIYHLEKLREEGPGKFRLAASGVGWMLSNKSKLVTIRAEDFAKFTWRRSTRRFQLRIKSLDDKLVIFSGFKQEDYESILSSVQTLFKKTVEQERLSVCGKNWGGIKLHDDTLSFICDDQKAFDIKIDTLSNSSVIAKNEVSLEFQQTLDTEDAKKEPSDLLVEVRFHVPVPIQQNTKYQDDDDQEEGSDEAESGKVENKTDEDEGSENEASDEGKDDEVAEDQVEVELQTPASIIVDEIKQKAGFTGSIDEPIISMGDLLCLTPRGRFSLEIHPEFFRLRGKSHDYKVLYKHVNEIFSVPKPDYAHQFFLIGLVQPLLQGQTRYPYLVFHIERECEVEITVDPQESEEKQVCAGKLKPYYDGPIHKVMEDILSTLSEKEVIGGADFGFSQQDRGIRCAHKANEVFLYCLKDSTLSLPKPVISLPDKDIASVKFTRVGISSVDSLKTFEICFTTNNGREYLFTSMPRETHAILESNYKSKKIRVISEYSDSSYTRKLENDDRDEFRNSKRMRNDENSDDENDQDYVTESESSGSP